MKRLIVLGAVALGSWGCGGAGPQGEPQTAAAASSDTAAKDGGGGDGMQMRQTVGALDGKEVRAIIQGTMSDVDKCVEDGRARLPWLGGGRLGWPPG